MAAKGTHRVRMVKREGVQQNLKVIRALLADKGYSFYAIHKRQRRHPHDFVALPDHNPLMMLVGRATENKVFVLHPFLQPVLYKRLARYLEENTVERQHALIRWGRQLPLRSWPRQWFHYLSPNSFSEWKRLNPEIVERFTATEPPR